jgi:hypothetical protein
MIDRTFWIKAHLILYCCLNGRGALNTKFTGIKKGIKNGEITIVFQNKK